MPTLLRWKRYRFHFYSREPDEPPHVHVIKGRAQAKFWLSDCSLAKSVGFRDHELSRIASKVRDERETFLEVWDDFFGRS
jgi:Domain of unknown function (DUF4160)